MSAYRVLDFLDYLLTDTLSLAHPSPDRDKPLFPRIPLDDPLSEHWQSAMGFEFDMADLDQSMGPHSGTSTPKNSRLNPGPFPLNFIDSDSKIRTPSPHCSYDDLPDSQQSELGSTGGKRHHVIDDPTMHEPPPSSRLFSSDDKDYISLYNDIRPYSSHTVADGHDNPQSRPFVLSHQNLKPLDLPWMDVAASFADMPFSPNTSPRIRYDDLPGKDLYFAGNDHPSLPQPGQEHRHSPSIGSVYSPGPGVSGVPEGQEGAGMHSVSRSHVSTQETSLASPVTMKQEVVLVCPVVGCGSTFTRSFNLKGTPILPRLTSTLTLDILFSPISCFAFPLQVFPY